MFVLKCYNKGIMTSDTIPSQPEQTPYVDRLRYAANPKHGEFWVRLVAGTALTTALVNTLPNAESPIKIGQDPQPDRTITQTTPYESTVPGEIATTTESGPAISINVPAEYANNFEATPINSEAETAVGGYYSTLAQLMADDPTIQSIAIDIHGSASDEDYYSNPLFGLGQASDENDALAVRRAELVDEVFGTYDTQNTIGVSSIDGEERILSDAEIAVLQETIAQHEMPVEDFIATYNYTPEETPLTPGEHEVVEGLLDNNRSVRIESTIERSVGPVIDSCDIVLEKIVDEVTTETVIPGTDGWKFEVAPFWLPPLPFTLRRRKKGAVSNTEDESKEALASAESEPEASTSEADTETTQPEKAGHTQQLIDRNVATLNRYYAREAARQERIQRAEKYKVPRRLALGTVGLAAVVLLIPNFHTHSDEADPVPADNEDCIAIETDGGLRFQIDATLPVIDAIDKHFGDNFEDTHITLYEDAIPNTTTVTRKEHETYFVDSNGNVIDQQHVPEDISSYETEATYSE